MDEGDIDTMTAYIALLKFGIRPMELIEMDTQSRAMITEWCWFWFRQEKKEREWQARLHKMEVR